MVDSKLEGNDRAVEDSLAVSPTDPNSTLDVDGLAFENSLTDGTDDSKKEKEVVIVESVSSDTALPPAVDEFPDGGLSAWLVVVGGVLAIFSTSGYLSSWGVFQTYYQLVFIPEKTPSQIAWIGSTQYAMLFFPALVTGRLCDMGYFKHTLLFFSVSLVVTTILVAECKTYWQLLICQGLLVGTSCGMIFGPVLTVIGHWFRRKRALALGTASFGGAVGGVIFPIAARRLFIEVGFPWTMRIIALILFVTLGVANLTMKRRLPVPEDLGPFFTLGDFKKPGFVLYIIAPVVTFLGLYTMITYIEVSAIEIGIDPDFAFYLVAIINAAGAFGRVFSGYLGDKFGGLTTLAPFTAVCGIMTFIWPFLKSKTGFVVASVVYGAAQGGFLSLLPVPVVVMGGVHDLGRRLGTAMAFISIAVVIGPPISGAIYTPAKGYKAVGYYAGSTIVASSFLLVLAKRAHTGKWRGKF